MLVFHGYRQNRQVALEYWEPLKEYVHLLAPDGPLVHEYGDPRQIGLAWYVYDGDFATFRDELDITCQSLDQIIIQASQDVDFDEIWVGGFSQGAYLALYYALSFNPAIKHIHAVAGNFNRKFPTHSLKSHKVWLHHGQYDKFCPQDRMVQLQNFLVEKGCQVNRHCFETGHRFLTQMNEPLIKRLSIASR